MKFTAKRRHLHRTAFGAVQVRPRSIIEGAKDALRALPYLRGEKEKEQISSLP
jgi:hypothetical protein